MEIFGYDIMNLFTWGNLIAIIVGSFIGMLIGALPGLGATIAIVLLLPFTYSMEPLASILLLLSVYQSAEYGGSISSIILGIPGTPAAAATVLDGNALAKQSSPGKALAYSLYSSSVGGIFGGLVLIFLSVPLVKLALALSDPEFFLIAVIGLVAVAGLGSKDVTKSLISMVLGLMAGTVGMDVISGVTRFGMGRPELFEGFNLVALIVGIFAIPSVFDMISEEMKKRYVTDHKGLQTKLSLKEFKAVLKPIGIGSVIGSIVGIIPGMGAGPSSWFAYSAAKSVSKSKSTFGKGNPEGIVAPETANNATVGGALVPLLSLGIPGSPVTAIIMGAFIIHGIQPGPKLFSTELDLVNGIFYGFLLTTVAMFFIGKFVTTGFSRVLTIPNPILIPMILAFSFVGTYAARYLFFDLWFVLIIGIVCYFLSKLDFSMPAMILAFVLSPMIEQSLRRSLILSDGSFTIFFTRFYSIILLLIILVIVVISIISRRKKQKQDNDPTITISS
jgi:putative tricarboxylic transport membrane protein